MDKPNHFISIITPAFNESKTLVELFTRTKIVMDNIGTDFEFIVVDDGSSDNTKDVFHEIATLYPRSILIQHAVNHGKSVALMQGFDIAQGDIAITIDADLQDHPEMIPRILDKMNEGYDLVNGWRHNRKDGAIKRALSHLFNFLTRLILACRLHDINCGLKAINRSTYKRLNLHGDMHRIIPSLAISMGCLVTEVPVTHSNRTFGVSRYHLLRHRGLLDIISLTAMQATQLRPFHVFFELGLLLILVGLGLGLAWSMIVLSGITGGVAEFWRGVTGFASGWALTFGSFLPLFGFLLEVNGARIQDKFWRRSLIRSISGAAFPSG